MRLLERRRTSKAHVIASRPWPRRARPLRNARRRRRARHRGHLHARRPGEGPPSWRRDFLRELDRRRRDFCVTFPRAHRERSTARRALAAPAVVNGGVELCACGIVPDSRRRRRGSMFQPGAARSALEKSLQDAARGVQAAHAASSARALDGYRDRPWMRPSHSSTRRGGAPYHRRHRESAASQQRAGPDRTGYCTRAGGV